MVIGHRPPPHDFDACSVVGYARAVARRRAHTLFTEPFRRQTRGCRLRPLRQEADLRQQPPLVAQDHQAPFRPQHPAGPRHRERDAQASQRLHPLHQGRQGHPLTLHVR
ncbi:hypothetical protein NOCARDAX2BIS_360003 [Nocardioides sp. AX2bis]|nr:hypothetical protein NOCARDAX2BIS_360003 [Nocardioides sp. AX2bis]